MKLSKIIYFTFLIIALIPILYALYNLAQIYFVVSVSNNITYDGLGYELVNGEVHNPHTIKYVIILFIGAGFFALINKIASELSKEKQT